MFRQARADLVVHAAAGIGAHGVDLRDWLAEARLGGRLQRVRHPVVEFGDHGAVERRAGIELHRAALQGGDMQGPREAADAGAGYLGGRLHIGRRLHALFGEAGVFGSRAPGRALRPVVNRAGRQQRHEPREGEIWQYATRHSRRDGEGALMQREERRLTQRIRPTVSFTPPHGSAAPASRAWPVRVTAGRARAPRPHSRRR